jgi:crotonobetainyl-CoA:carnitine CoA-transferase CaiB-like acyl-CoA transferase
MTKPLAGVRVLDLSNIIAGPLCTYQLVQLGADVIKVERPGTGDLSRKMGADPAMGRQNMGASFLSSNAGKRSITLDLQQARGRELFRRMAEGADVVFENFRPGVMARLGLGYDDLKTVNPGLVYCAVSGFGQDGPLSGRPAYDQIIQGYSGLMSVTGTAETGPFRAGYVVCDTMGAMTAAFAIVAALYRKQATGEGAFIDVAMLDASLVTMAAWVISNYVNAGSQPRPLGNESHSAAPSGAFATKDGQINLVNNEQKQFELTCDVIGRPDLKTHPHYADRDDRLTHRAALRQELEAALRTRTGAEWEEAFAAAGVPAGRIYTVPEILEHPHIKERGITQTFAGAGHDGRDVTVSTRGFRFVNEDLALDRPPPTLGQDSEDVLRELGLGDDEIAALRQDGTV